MFKPSNRDAELRQWPDWMFTFMQIVKAVEPRTAELLETINKQPNGNYELEEMDDDTNIKNRPPSLIQHLEDFNGSKRMEIVGL